MSDASLATGTQSISVGDSLRNARMAAGWTVPDVAKKLNLTPSAVEFIESNQFECLPGTTFARGYIRSYAKVLGLDANQFAQHFDQQFVGSATAGSVQSIDRVGEARRVSRGMLQFSLFVVLLIILGAGYYAWEVFNAADTDVSNKPAVFERVEVERADGSVHVQTLDEPEDQAVAFGLDANVVNDTDSGELAVVDTGAEPAQTLGADGETAVELMTAQSDADKKPLEDKPPVAELAAGMGAAQLTFANDCWIRIVDANGKEISSGLKRAGESVSVTGQAPLDVRLGYAKGVSITYNGEAVDFSSAVRGATAKFKLGE